MKTRVSAPSRLHFGLLNTGNLPGVPRFGGCGLMITSPGVVVTAEPANEWSGAGPNAERAVAFAKRVTTECHRIVVERCPPEHVGLGVGTSLGLAVAKAIRPDMATSLLALMTGRVLRSGVGLAGFDQGGFVVDFGKPEPDEQPGYTIRKSFPSNWRVVLARPPITALWHGGTERAAFLQSCLPDDPMRHYREMDEALSWVNSRVEIGDRFIDFAEAVHHFNREAGRWFETAQGGLYADPAIAGLIDRIRELGFVGVGQSSWGPTVFAFAADPDRAEWLADRLRRDDPSLHVETTAAANHGAVVSRASPESARP